MRHTSCLFSIKMTFFQSSFTLNELNVAPKESFETKKTEQNLETFIKDKYLEKLQRFPERVERTSESGELQN